MPDRKKFTNEERQKFIEEASQTSAQEVADKYGFDAAYISRWKNKNKPKRAKTRQIRAVAPAMSANNKELETLKTENKKLKAKLIALLLED